MSVEINKLLLPRENYEEESQKLGPSPHTFEIRKKGQTLFYFGANHSSDPNNKQYSLLKSYWERFIEETEGNDKVVLTEIALYPVEKDEETAIKIGAEGSFITFLASKEHVPVDCSDINTAEFIKLRPDVDPELMLLITFLRLVDSFQKGPKDGLSFEEEFSKWSTNPSRKEIYKEEVISLEKLKVLYKKYIGRDFVSTDNQNDLVNPNKDICITNRLVREQSDLREIKIVEGIKKYWDEGKSIFVVFGSGHLIIQKPALENLLT